MKEKQYIGDGAYAEFDGYSVVLTTSDGMCNTNQVCMEPEVVKNFLRYFASIGSGAVTMLRNVLAECAPVETPAANDAEVEA